MTREVKTETSACGTLVVSLDFELFWGVRDIIAVEDYRDRLLGTHRVVPLLLDLFRDYGIHATWAIVGFLFFESQKELVNHLPNRKPAYADQRLSPYPYISNMDGDGRNDLYHFAPSLVQRIQAMPGQELATQTFSHYYCLEDGQTGEDFKEDLEFAIQQAEKVGCRIRSLIFPRNQFNPEYLPICKELGITACRANEAAWYYQGKKRRDYNYLPSRAFRLMDSYLNLSGDNCYPLPSYGDFPISLPSSRYLRPYSSRLHFLDPLRQKRITTAMTKAARANQIYHLWWHPEDVAININENLDFMKILLDHFNELKSKYGMQSLNMEEVTSRCQQEAEFRICI